MARLTDRPDMTIAVYCGRKTTQQQQQQYSNLYGKNVIVNIAFYRNSYGVIVNIALYRNSYGVPRGSKPPIFLKYGSTRIGAFDPLGTP